VTTQSYDDHGRVSSVTQASGTSIASTITFTYDLYGHVLCKTAPDGGMTHYVYDIYDHVIKLTDPLGKHYQLQL